MNTQALTFYEELKKLRQSTEILSVISKRIVHAEEALRQNANGFTTEITIGDGEWLSWKEHSFPEQKSKPLNHIVYSVQQGNHTIESQLRNTKADIRLRCYPFVIELVREVNAKLQKMIVSIDIGNESVDVINEFEKELVEIKLKGME